MLGTPVRSVVSVPVARLGPVRDAAASSVKARPLAARLPAAGTFVVAAPAVGLARAGASPVWVGSVLGPAGKPVAAAATVQVLGQAATRGLGGQVAAMRVSAPVGSRSVRVGLDLSGFVGSYGANYVDRLRLFAAPACAASTPDVPACRPKVLASAKDYATSSMTATVPLAAGSVGVAQVRATAAAPAQTTVTVFAAAVATGNGGDYTASPIKPNGSWSVGLESGSFEYSYPVAVPPSVGGAAPEVSLSYDSGSVDGRTTASNGQVSVVGQGWTMPESFIERRYTGCASEPDAVAKNMSTWGDLCWSPDASYVLSMNGQSHDLVPVLGTPLTQDFRLRDDPGWRVTRNVGAANGDGGNPGLDQGEWWVVTTTDGTAYTFGKGVTPFAPAVTTNSVDTVLVYGDDPNEPCYQALSGVYGCNQAWRWNLDQVVDRSGNAMGYTYLQEMNKYANGKTASGWAYVRASLMDEIQYGARAGAAYTASVGFRYARRCSQQIDYPFSALVACPAFDAANASSYPDSPVDLYCPVTASTCNTTTQAAPTFFSANRLYEIDTFVRDVSVATPTVTQVDRYQLRHMFPDPDAAGPETPDLWLSQIVRTGMSGTAITLPTIYFLGQILQNRVDAPAGVLKLLKYRVDGFVNELGGEVDVTYGHASVAQECTQAIVSPTPGPYPANTQTRECFPRYWKPEGASSVAGFAWFHKWVVKRVVQVDRATGTQLNPPGQVLSEPMVTDYEYQGVGAWHHDDDPTAPASTQSWSEWRGYQNVIVHSIWVRDGVIQVNAANGQALDRVQTRYTFFRGMHLDKADAAGNTRNVTVDTVETTPATDWNLLRGQIVERQDQTDAGVDLRREWFGYWWTRTLDLPETSGADYRTSRDAFMVLNSQNAVRLRADGVDSKVKTKVIRDFYLPAATDPRNIRAGAPLTEQDLGDEATAADDRCTQFWQTSNSTVWVIKPSREILYPVTACGGTGIARTDHLYDTQTTFGSTETTQLTTGLETQTLRFTSGTTPITTTTAYDAYGRVTQTTDGRGSPTLTAYTPATGRPATLTVTGPSPNAAGNATGLVTTTDLSIGRSQPVKITDPNLGVTTITYDSLGRLTAVRKPGQQASAHDTLQFTYGIAPDPGNNAKPAQVITKALQNDTGTGTYVGTWSYLDGWGRPIQTQTIAPGGTETGGGRIITVTRYDDRGLVQGSSGPIASTGPVTGGWVGLSRDTFPSEARTGYDELERPTVATTMAIPPGGGLTTEQWHTTTTWDGNGSVTDPLTGGNVENVTDARGHLTQVKEYLADNTTVYATTAMTYTARDELASVTSPAGKVQTFTYDWLGRRTATTDPDTGASTSTYDGNGNVLTTTDARAVTVTTDYDYLNRATRRYTGTPAAPTVLTSWAYDAAGVANGKGRLASATAKVVEPGTTTAKDYTQSVTGYDPNGNTLGATWTVPAGYGIPTAQIYTETYGYDAAGHVTTAGLPAAGGLPAETVTATWSGLGLPQTLASSVGGTLVSSTGFDALARLTGRQWASGTGPSRGYGYDGLNRLTGATTTIGGVAKQNDTYTYTGPDLTQVSDTLTTQGQCYTYDDLRRLARAWTLNTTGGITCNPTTPNPAHAYNPAGAPAYDQTWAYDTDNNLTTLTDLVPATPAVTTLGGPRPGRQTRPRRHHHHRPRCGHPHPRLRPLRVPHLPHPRHRHRRHPHLGHPAPARPVRRRRRGHHLRLRPRRHPPDPQDPHRNHPHPRNQRDRLPRHRRHHDRAALLHPRRGPGRPTHLHHHRQHRLDLACCRPPRLHRHQHRRHHRHLHPHPLHPLRTSPHHPRHIRHRPPHHRQRLARQDPRHHHRPQPPRRPLLRRRPRPVHRPRPPARPHQPPHPQPLHLRRRQPRHLQRPHRPVLPELRHGPVRGFQLRLAHPRQRLQGRRWQQRGRVQRGIRWAHLGQDQDPSAGCLDLQWPRRGRSMQQVGGYR